MGIDTSLLTDDQKAEVKYWAEFFEGHGFKELRKEAERQLEALEATFHSVRGEQNLGYLQGAAASMRWLVNLPRTRELQLAVEYGVIGTEPQEPDTDRYSLA
jgi:hypothetical protein